MSNNRYHNRLEFCPPISIAELELGGKQFQAVLQRETQSGSHKDHAGRFLVNDNKRQGIISSSKRTRFVVPSSGNFGHSIATTRAMRMLKS